MATVTRHKYGVLLLVVLMLGFGVWSVFHTKVQDTEILTGVVDGHHVFLHDEGHTRYLLVRVPDRERLVRVVLPQRSPFLEGARVELYRNHASDSSNERYLFKGYLNQSNEQK
ncbi:hypothetical protein [Ferrimonas sp.]|uniref:hypothetical protein n=1 Tax=Ferrimonas sp. TaxID=2080861 RepID=UPI003A8FBC0A